MAWIYDVDINYDSIIFHIIKDSRRGSRIQAFFNGRGDFLIDLI